MLNCLFCFYSAPDSSPWGAVLPAEPSLKMSSQTHCRCPGGFFIKLAITPECHRKQLALIHTRQDADRLLVLFVGAF